MNVEFHLASGYNLEELQLNLFKNWHSEATYMCVCVCVCVYVCVCVCVCVYVL